MNDFRISVDIGDLLPPGAQLGYVFPHLAIGVKKIAIAAMGNWQRYARGEPLPNGHSITPRTGTYLRSIQLKQISEFNFEIYSDVPYAQVIENGAGSRDMKAMLGSSLKVRINQKGRRYLIIPFRWGTPGTVGFGSQVMPNEVHDLWKGLEPSHVTGRRREPSPTGAYNIRTRKPAMVSRRTYLWGNRLKAKALQNMGLKDTQISRMKGMVHFQKRGASTHGKYLTFRVMSEDSTGWILPSQPAKEPAKLTAKKFQPIAESVFAKAVEADISWGLQQ